MGIKHIILVFQFAVFVYGDVLLDYTAKCLEDGLPNWILEELDDSFPMDTEFDVPRRAAFMEYSLKEWNVTATGMKSIRLLEKPEISGSIFSGDLAINFRTTVDLNLSGKYNASYGNLFPFMDNIPYDSLGMWSADATVVTSQLYYIFMNASKDGSMNLVSQYQSWDPYTAQTYVYNLQFDKFLEDHLNKWYYPINVDGFRKDLEDRVRSSFLYDRIDVFGGFFEKIFQNINYFDIIERKK